MDAACSQALWLRAGWTSVAVTALTTTVTSTTFVTSASTTFAASAITTPAAAVPSTAFATSAVTTTTVVTASTTFAASAVTTTTTSAAIAASASTTAAVPSTTFATSALADKLGGHATLVLTRTEDLKRLLLGALGLWRQYGGDEHTVDSEVGIDANDIADLCSFVQKRAIQLALGLLRPGLAPGVGPIITFAGQLDLKAS